VKLPSFGVVTSEYNYIRFWILDESLLLIKQFSAPYVQLWVQQINMLFLQYTFTWLINHCISCCVLAYFFLVGVGINFLVKGATGDDGFMVIHSNKDHNDMVPHPLAPYGGSAFHSVGGMVKLSEM
jgi:hypothetical protein